MRRRRALALALGALALAIPATASAEPIDGGEAITSGQSEPSQPAGGSDYSTVNAIAPPPSSPTGSGESPSSDSSYSSVNAITGAPAGEPTLVSDSPSVSGEGFDWGSALVGAGAAMALAALCGAALLTVRRRTTISPSASTS